MATWANGVFDAASERDMRDDAISICYSQLAGPQTTLAGRLWTKLFPGE